MSEENIEPVRLATVALQAHERLHLHLRQSHRHTNGTVLFIEDNIVMPC